jgi:Amt family ammonium transporter
MIQGAAVLAAIVYSGVASFVILKLVGLVVPLRATSTEESEGLDITAHGEEAYTFGGSMSDDAIALESEKPASVLKPVSADV